LLWTVTVLVSVAVLAIASGASGKAHSSKLPVHFPYAAEIQATIRYDGTYTISHSFSQPCSTAEGGVYRVPVNDHDTLHFERTVYFSHITVPVATPGELGKAAAKLGLEPTVTTPGVIKNDHSTIDLEDQGVEGEGEGCHSVSVECHWELTPVPSSALEEITTHDDGVMPASWTISVLGYNNPVGPSSCGGSTGTETLSALLEDAGKLYPEELLQTFPEITISRALGGDFHRLQKHETSDFEVAVNMPESGTSNCSTHLEEEVETCTHSVTGRAEVELHRRFLYFSKHTYDR
jgi:hypothetical protein